MTKKEARKIGSKFALFGALIGLVIAQGIMTYLTQGPNLLDGFLWFTDFYYIWNILFAIIVFLAASSYFGKIAGERILIRNQNASLVGILSGLMILFITSFAASWVGFFQEGISEFDSGGSPFFNYIYKPVYWVMFFGFLPVVGLGLLYGWIVRRYRDHRST